MRRWPSWTKTTETTTPRATIGKKSFSTGVPFSQAWMPAGAEVRIEAKMSSEIPLPIPRLVICSPIHMRRVVPAVSVTMISTSRPVSSLRPPVRWNR